MKSMFDQKGFSLIEVIVALLIFSVIVFYFGNIFSYFVKNNQTTIIMSKEIKESVSSIERAISQGILPQEMIVDDSAVMTITTNGGLITIEGYILEGVGDAGNVAFFPKNN